MTDIMTSLADTLVIPMSDKAKIKLLLSGDLSVDTGHVTEQVVGGTPCVLPERLHRPTLTDEEIHALIQQLQNILSFRQWNAEQDHVTDEDLVNVGRIEARREHREADISKRMAEYAKKDRRNDPEVVALGIVSKAIHDALHKGATPEDVDAMIGKARKVFVQGEGENEVYFQYTTPKKSEEKT